MATTTGSVSSAAMNGAAKAASVDDTHAQASKTARSCGYRNAIKRGDLELGATKHTLDQRHQCFGMTALHRQRFLHAYVRMRGVEHSDRTGFERSINGKDAHSEPGCHHP